MILKDEMGRKLAPCGKCLAPPHGQGCQCQRKSRPIPSTFKPIDTGYQRSIRAKKEAEAKEQAKPVPKAAREIPEIHHRAGEKSLLAELRGINFNLGEILAHLKKNDAPL